MHNLIIDGNNIISACIAKNVEDYTLYDEYIGGVTGFLKSLSKLINTPELHPDRVFIVFDVDKSAMRLHLYPEYKGNRGVYTDAELETRMKHKDSHIEILRNILPYLNCHVLAIKDVEADDVIANFVKQTKHETTIVSADKDMIQLLNDKTGLYRTIKTIEYLTIDNVEEYLGYPYQWSKYVKILAGDASDNITSIKGIGEKTAVNILKKVNPDDLLNDNKEKIKEQLIELSKLEKPNYLPKLKLYLDEGVYDLNQKIIDLDNAPYINIKEHIYKTEYDIEKFKTILDELGIVDFDVDFWTRGMGKIKC